MCSRQKIILFGCRFLQTTSDAGQVSSRRVFEWQDPRLHAILLTPRFWGDVLLHTLLPLAVVLRAGTLRANLAALRKTAGAEKLEKIWRRKLSGFAAAWGAYAAATAGLLVTGGAAWGAAEGRDHLLHSVSMVSS